MKFLSYFLRACFYVTVAAFDVNRLTSYNEGYTTDDLTQNFFNFKHHCEGNIIRHGSKVLNTNGLRFSAEDAKDIEKYLLDQSLAERMLTWAYMCRLQALIKGHEVDMDISQMNYFEGDIILTPEQARYIYMQALGARSKKSRIVDPEAQFQFWNLEHHRTKRKVLDLESAQWGTDEPIRWGFNNTADYTLAEAEKIRDAFDVWQNNTCLRFSEETPCCEELAAPAIKIQTATGCAAYIGRQKNFTGMLLQPECTNSVGTLQHEIGHTLGMWHEQSRPDRDNYVTIFLDNIQEGFESNFDKEGYMRTYTFGLPYDYASVMHYQINAFRISRPYFTLLPKRIEYARTVGQRRGASFFDFKSINIKYCSSACDGYSTLEWDACEKHGYRDPHNCNMCVCQKGWSPPFCKHPTVNKHPYCQSSDIAVQNSIQTVSFLFDGLASTDISCTYLFHVQKGQVKLILDSNFDWSCYFTCQSYVEIRTDIMAFEGPRYCCGNWDKTVFYSSGNQLMVRIELRASENGSLVIQYKHVDCGGSSDTALYELPCILPVESIESKRHGAWCATSPYVYVRCIKVRKMHMLSSKQHCYSNYKLKYGRCIRNPPCGGCKSSHRQMNACVQYKKKVIRYCSYYNKRCWRYQYRLRNVKEYYCCKGYKLVKSISGSTYVCFKMGHRRWMTLLH